MAEAGFQDVLLGAGIAARGFAGNQSLGVTRRDAQIEDQVFARKAVNVVFEMLDPGHEFGALFCGCARNLVCEVRADVAVGEDDCAGVERGL